MHLEDKKGRILFSPCKENEEMASMYLPIWYYVYTKRIIIALMKRKILATFGSSKVTKPSLVYVLGHHIL